MTTAGTSKMTVDEFWDWCGRPENENRRFELVRGEGVEVPSPGCLHGVLCSWISHLLWGYVLQRGSGRVATNDTGLVVHRNPDTLRGPDVMLFDQSRNVEDLSPRYTEDVPRLVVEVRSPHDSWSRMVARVNEYLQHGVPLVWLVDPEERAITVCRPGEFPRVLDEEEVLTGNGVLPEFTVRVSQVFQLPGTNSGKA